MSCNKQIVPKQITYTTHLGGGCHGSKLCFILMIMMKIKIVQILFYFFLIVLSSSNWKDMGEKSKVGFPYEGKVGVARKGKWIVYTT